MDYIKWFAIFVAVCVIAGWLGDQKTSKCEWCYREFKGNSTFCSEECYNLAVECGYDNSSTDISDDYGAGPF